MSDGPQLENGFTRLSNELLEDLAKAGLSLTETWIVFVIARLTYGFRRKTSVISKKKVSDLTGFDKSQVSRGWKTLIEKNIIFQFESGEVGIQKRKAYWKIVDSESTLVVKSSTLVDEKSTHVDSSSTERNGVVEKSTLVVKSSTFKETGELTNNQLQVDESSTSQNPIHKISSGDLDPEIKEKENQKDKDRKEREDFLQSKKGDPTESWGPDHDLNPECPDPLTGNLFSNSQEKQKKPVNPEKLWGSHFEDFWENHCWVKTAKAYAEECWKRIPAKLKLKTQEDIEKTFPLICQAADNYRAYLAIDGAHMPCNPSTWLNQKRWEDDYAEMTRIAELKGETKQQKLFKKIIKGCQEWEPEPKQQE